jgi:TPR repeat protein
LEVARKHLVCAAQGGSLVGCAALAELYRYGLGVGVDLEQARRWAGLALRGGLHEAADGGLPGSAGSSDLGLCGGGGTADAQARVGALCLAALAGAGARKSPPEQDAKAAFFYLRRSAEQGHSQAQRMLGHCYLRGFGVTEDAEVGELYMKLSLQPRQLVEVVPKSSAHAEWKRLASYPHVARFVPQLQELAEYNKLL